MDGVRTFIAIELTPEILDKLGNLQARIREAVPPGLVRWVQPQGIHLTLKFLGEVPSSKVDDVAAAVQKAGASYAPFTLQVGGTGCFPNVHRPRVVWVGVQESSGTLQKLQGEIERAMVPLGYPPEGRGFHPHLTLGRVKGGSRDALEALGQYVHRANVQVGQMAVSAVHVMRSDLLPGGAVYTALSVTHLDG
jgi:2'-5' RNA ligase